MNLIGKFVRFEHPRVKNGEVNWMYGIVAHKDEFGYYSLIWIRDDKTNFLKCCGLRNLGYFLEKN